MRQRIWEEGDEKEGEQITRQEALVRRKKRGYKES
jgi:hypothetical protein